MNFNSLNGQTIQDAFEEFHANNPQVYAQFVRLSFQAINAGKKKLSFKMIMNVIRWEVYISTDDKASTYKINDAYGSRYARLFIQQNPQYTHMVETRKLRTP